MIFSTLITITSSKVACALPWNIFPKRCRAPTATTARSPEHSGIRLPGEESGQIVRRRASNPKWVSETMRHGHRGGFEMAMTLVTSSLLLMATDAVGSHHFSALLSVYLCESDVLTLLCENNPKALREIGKRFGDAHRRWRFGNIPSTRHRT